MSNVLSYRIEKAPELYDSKYFTEQLRLLHSRITYPVVAILQVTTLNSAPDKITTGMMVRADGTNWDPGHGKGFYEYDGEDWRPMFNLNVGQVTADSTVVNTTTETEIYSYTFAANALLVDEAWELIIGGAYSVNAASDTFTLRLKLNGTTIHTIARQSGNNVTNAGWSLRHVANVRTAGASGTLRDLGILNDDNTSIAVSEAAGHSIDTTAANVLSLTIQWGTASVNNTLTLSTGFLEVKHP